MAMVCLYLVSGQGSFFYGCVSAQESGKETYAWINLYHTIMIPELRILLEDEIGPLGMTQN